MKNERKIPSAYLTPFEQPPLKLLLPKRKIEALRDDDEDKPLMIDERKSSSKPKPAKIGKDSHRGPIKLRLSGESLASCNPSGTIFICFNFHLVGGRSELQLSEACPEVAAHCDIETGDEVANNSGGIEDLLRAGSQALDAVDEREAIVGMLSMSRGFSSPDPTGRRLSGNQSSSAASSQRNRKGRRQLNTSLSDDYGDGISKVHQDDDYSTKTV